MPPRHPAMDRFHAACGVTPTGDDRAVGETDDAGVARVGIYGGQMIAKALSACAHTVPDGTVPESMHANLLSGGRVGEPIEFRVDRIRTGRNLQHREVRGFQGDKCIVQATVVSAVPRDGFDWQRLSMPDCGGPDERPDAPEPWGRFLGWGVFEVAHRQTDDPDPVAHPVWIRCPFDLPDDPWARAAAYAFWSDFGPNWVTRVSHADLSGDEDHVQSVSATHSIWFHRQTPLDRWHLFDAVTHSLAGHQGMVHATLHDAHGDLTASLSQGVFIPG